MPVEDPTGEARCGDDEGSVLGIATVSAGSNARHEGHWLPEPRGILPPNINAIYHGPSDVVMLTSRCEGVTRPVAFARVDAIGNFNDVQLVGDVFADTYWVGQLRWLWSRALSPDDLYESGELIAVIPQIGMGDGNSSTESISDVYFAVDSGHVIDVHPALNGLPNGFGPVSISHDGTLDGAEIEFVDATGDFSGPLAALAEPPFGAIDGRRAAVGGPNGSIVVSSSVSDLGPVFDQARTDPRPVSGAAWSVLGEWLALSGPDGSRLVNGEATIELSSEPSDTVFFSPDETPLVTANADRYEVHLFGTWTPPASGLVAATDRLDSGGIGPIRVDMSVSELRNGAYPSITMTAGGVTPQPGFCVWIDIPELPGVSMLGEATSETDAVITAISVRQGPWRTPSGLGLVSTHDQVFDAWDDRVHGRPHAYDDGGYYLTFIPEDASDPYSIKFDSYGQDVYVMSAGRSDWISLVEGCA